MSYISPIKDTKFILENLLERSTLIESETIDAVLKEAGKLANDNLAPLYYSGDKNPPKLRQDHEVVTSPGFKEGFKAVASGGWIGVSSDPNYEGMGLPFRMATAVNEYWHGSNMSFALCNLLSQGIMDALTLVGTEEQKQMYLPKLNKGLWTGTMNLTEPQSGTDLSTIKTKAFFDGLNWKIKGQKIYITYGEHDFSENIVHLVLARTEGSPEGIKGISTFLIPKFLFDESGKITERNDLKCVSLEHKLGIKASPTAVMSYGDEDGAIGYMLGEEGRGIEYMFIMMNRARFDVGLQGMAISETARQKALEYAKTRIQGVPINKSAGTSIIGHGDVKRQLLLMKSLTESMRVLILVSAEVMEKAQVGDQFSQNLESFLIPIIKGWCTELAQEVTSLGVQIHGGMGFIEETGAAQIMRDARILPIYEGTNGIQANDLMFRKTLRDNGKTAFDLLSRINQDINDDNEILKYFNHAKDTINYIINHKDDKEALSCISYDYMMGFGYLIGAWLMNKSKTIALKKLQSGASDKDFLNGKIISSDFYNLHILPRVSTHFKVVTDGSNVVMNTLDSYI